ncbi:MAG: glycogen synthase GlgA [Planctomycetota bacterium]|nr:glycogen synthase GlgA [Planctomycetota bacterium]
MKIVLTSSEAVPFGKTGGLADVASGLPKALAKRGHDVSLFVPHYPQFIDQSISHTRLFDFNVPINLAIGEETIAGSVLKTVLPDSNVDVYLVDQPELFDRDGIYQSAGGGQYTDNCKRFAFFCRAIMQAIDTLQLCPDVIHANDWQTGLIPALLATEYREQPGFEKTRSVMTIHNLAFQGRSWHFDMQLTGMDWKYFNWEQMESWGELNLLKTGIVFADKITTVSPTYAAEIQTPQFGCGLDAVLRHWSDDLLGIINGSDTDLWNPATDPHIALRYDASTIVAGKAKCKQALQHELGLDEKAHVPLFGMVSRMTDQKGFDLLEHIETQLIDSGAQFAFLGSGEPQFETFIAKLASEHPKQVAAKIGFDNGLAHRIEAGSDAYLMPSYFEPCGLNQMYSMQYGTVPLVCRVGGLADTVVDASTENMATNQANGFSFDRIPQTGEYTFNPQDADQLAFQIERVIDMYRNPELWNQLRMRGILQDWSWTPSAAKFEELYKEIVSAALEDAA